MNMVRMLQYHSIRPVLVFDGAPLPTKLGKEEERRAYSFMLRSSNDVHYEYMPLIIL